MFNYNSKTECHRTFKFSELSKNINFSKEARIENKYIDSIVLSNILSPSTMNCNPSDFVKEIYIFDIIVNQDSIPYNLICELDNFIELHTLFRVKYDNKISFTFSYKEQNVKIKINDYKVKVEDVVTKKDLIAFHKVNDIYKQIIREFVLIEPFYNESINSYYNRYKEIIKIEKVIDKLTKSLNSTSQSKRKFEINKELKIKKEIKDNLLKE